MNLSSFLLLVFCEKDPFKISGLLIKVQLNNQKLQQQTWRTQNTKNPILFLSKSTETLKTLFQSGHCRSLSWIPCYQTKHLGIFNSTWLYVTELMLKKTEKCEWFELFKGFCVFMTTPLQKGKSCFYANMLNQSLTSSSAFRYL